MDKLSKDMFSPDNIVIGEEQIKLTNLQNNIILIMLAQNFDLKGTDIKTRIKKFDTEEACKELLHIVNQSKSLDEVLAKIDL